MAALASRFLHASASLLTSGDQGLRQKASENQQSSSAGLTAGHNLRSAAWLADLTLSAKGTSRGQVPATSRRGLQVRAEVRSEQKVKVVLGPYKDGVLKAQAPAPKVSEEEIQKALAAKSAKKYVLERVNFTGSGAKLGHTVRLRFEGRYLEGPSAGQTIKGTKADNYELELKEGGEEPWSTFVREITKLGMGQEETRSFQLQFPENYKAKTLAGVKAQFTVTVMEIGVKKMLAEDGRSESEQRAAVEAELRAVAERSSNDVADAQIREAVLATSQADVEKMAASVTWAKFGVKSLQDYKWNVIQEEIARVEKITFEQVPAFLRAQATITHT